MGQTLAGFTDDHLFDMAMKTFAVETELKERGLTEQTLRIDIRIFADQFNLDRVQGADGLYTVKGEDFEIITNSGNVQREMRRIGRPEHTLIPYQARCANRPWLCTQKIGGHVNNGANRLM